MIGASTSVVQGQRAESLMVAFEDFLDNELFAVTSWTMSLPLNCLGHSVALALKGAAAKGECKLYMPAPLFGSRVEDSE